MGKRYTRLYKIWCGMKYRCYNANYDGYNNYGGRGIIVCQEWINDFGNFYEWAIKNGYKDTLTIERIDVNGNYCPENCKWATMKEQENNKRNNTVLEYNGEKRTVSEWADKLQVSKETLYSRLKSGWSVERVLTEK